MIEKIIIPYGYSKAGYFGEEKRYDTGIVIVSFSQLQVLIKVFLQHQ